MQRLLKVFLTAIITVLTLSSCIKQTSLTKGSFSDNKSFYKRGYAKQTPIRPFGNLSNLHYFEVDSINFYDNYVEDGMEHIRENKEYFFWLNAEVKKRKAKKERNWFYQETTPNMNEYYIKKTLLYGGKVHQNERRYFDIKTQTLKAKKRYTNKEKVYVKDEIDTYEIKETIPTTFTVEDEVTSYE